MRWSEFNANIYNLSFFLFSFLLLVGCQPEPEEPQKEKSSASKKEEIHVEVVVSPLSKEITQIVSKERDLLDKKCKAEIQEALKGSDKSVNVKDLHIDNIRNQKPIELEKVVPHLKVVFTESADILEPKIICGEDEVQTYLLPISYVLNFEKGLITNVFLAGNGVGIIHGKCREASTGLSSARQIRQVRL